MIAPRSMGAALAIILGGGALTALAWRRAWTILARSDAREAVLAAEVSHPDFDRSTQPTTAKHDNSVLAND